MKSDVTVDFIQGTVYGGILGLAVGTYCNGDPSSLIGAIIGLFIGTLLLYKVFIK